MLCINRCCFELKVLVTVFLDNLQLESSYKHFGNINVVAELEWPLQQTLQLRVFGWDLNCCSENSGLFI